MPAGSRLLSEEEREHMLKELNENKKEVENLLGKMPLSMKTMSI